MSGNVGDGLLTGVLFEWWAFEDFGRLLLLFMYESDGLGPWLIHGSVLEKLGLGFHVMGQSFINL